MNSGAVTFTKVYYANESASSYKSYKTLDVYDFILIAIIDHNLTFN